MKPSIPSAVCHGPVQLSETEDFAAFLEEKKVRTLVNFARAINNRERALWHAAEKLSDFGEGQGVIYGELLQAGRDEMRVRRTEA